MTAFYREINPIQEPTDRGVDTNERAVVVFNVNVVKSPSETVLEEIAKILVDAGVGVKNSDLFASTKARIPTGDGPYITLVETGGTFPIWKQNSNTPSEQRPSIQITVRAGGNTPYETAKSKAVEAYNALIVIKNQIITFP